MLGDDSFDSIKEEREMLLAHRARLSAALEQIAAIAAESIARPRKNEALIAIRDKANAALML